MKFANGKSYEDALSLSETHQIPFQKDNIDFFMVTIDDISNSEVKIYKIWMVNRCVEFMNQIINVRVCFVNKSTEITTQIQWNCAWIEIRDIFYQRNYW